MIQSTGIFADLSASRTIAACLDFCAYSIHNRLVSSPEAPIYALILQDEFACRKKLNNSYSLRAFSKLLKLSHSTLSLLMRGKVGLSPETAKSIAMNLGFSSDEVAYFVDLVIAESARSETKKCEARQRLTQYNTRFSAMSLDTRAFEVISAWYSFPAMELVRMYGEKADAAFIAERLGISESDAASTLSNLRDLKIVVGHQVASSLVSLPDGPANQAAQIFHRTILEKATQAVGGPKDLRNITTQVIRMRRCDLVWAAKELASFRRKLAARLEEGVEHDTIYSISTQWLRLDKDV